MDLKTFVEKYRHTISGLVLDAMFGEQAHGGELSVRLRTTLHRIDNLLAEMYREFPHTEPAKVDPPKSPPAATSPAGANPRP